MKMVGGMRNVQSVYQRPRSEAAEGPSSLGGVVGGVPARVEGLQGPRSQGRVVGGVEGLM